MTDADEVSLHDQIERDLLALRCSREAVPRGIAARHGASPPQRPRVWERTALYELDDVRAALGLAPSDDGYEGDPAEREPVALPNETEHQCKLSALLRRGDTGRWRFSLGPTEAAIERIDALRAAAPHLGDLIDLFARNMRACRAMDMPASIPPVLVVGGAGLGKSWLLRRLAEAIDLPFREYPMSASSLSEGIQGAHPSWRNAQPGVVARALLSERVANPLVLVDEFDKVSAGSHNTDPYRAFYQALEPQNASRFVDEYLGFPIDASHVIWCLAANGTAGVPTPIMDRLTVVEVPAELTAAQRQAIAASIYADANAARHGWFAPEPTGSVLGRLAGSHPRAMRLAVEDAMVRAAAVGRRELLPDDVVPRGEASRPRYGFV